MQLAHNGSLSISHCMPQPNQGTTTVGYRRRVGWVRVELRFVKGAQNNFRKVAKKIEKRLWHAHTHTEKKDFFLTAVADFGKVQQLKRFLVFPFPILFFPPPPAAQECCRHRWVLETQQKSGPPSSFLRSLSCFRPLVRYEKRLLLDNPTFFQKI